MVPGEDVLAKWKMVCVDPQAQKLRVCSHGRLRCGTELAQAQIFMAAFSALQLPSSTKSWTVHVVLALKHGWQHLENISEGKPYACPPSHCHPVPSDPWPLWRCLLWVTHWGSPAGSINWCKPAFKSRGQGRVTLGNAFWLSFFPTDGSENEIEKNLQARRKQDI